MKAHGAFTSGLAHRSKKDRHKTWWKDLTSKDIVESMEDLWAHLRKGIFLI